MTRIPKVPLVIPVAIFTCSVTIASVWGYNALRKVDATVNDNIKIYYDNKEKVFKEIDGSKISPVIINGSTYLPLRAVADLAGLGIEWDSANQAVKISSSNEGIPYKDNIPLINSDSSSNNSNHNNNNNKDVKGEFSLWHFNKDEGPNIVKTFIESYPNVRVNLSIIPDMDQQYQNKLTAAIRAGSGAPDVFALESSFTKRFVDMPDALADLTERSKSFIGNMIPYTVEMGTDKNGILRALSHNANPVALAYKKGAAKKYLGTDDSDSISEMLSTPEKILATSRALKAKSGGKVALFPSFQEPQKMYLGGRSHGWVVDGKLTIDQKVLDFIDFAKICRDNKFEAGMDQWSPAWSAAIAKDEEALVWTCPTWGVQWIIGSNDRQAVDGGRWGLARPSYPCFWGGSWFGIYSKSQNKDTAWNFIKHFTTDKNTMKKWAESNQDFPNNLEAIAEGSSYENNIMGTDLYKFYEPFLKEIKGDIHTMYDDNIETIFTECMRSYLAGQIKTRELMIKTFKDKVKMNYRDLYVE